MKWIVFESLFLSIVLVTCSLAAPQIPQAPGSGDNIPMGQPPRSDSQIPQGQGEEQDLPKGQADIDADVFGKDQGRFHPFLSVEAKYMDNVFITNEDTKTDLITTIAPGFWLAVPGNRERLLKISTSNTSPGGLQMSRIKPDATRRYQAYFMYSPEFVNFMDHSQHNHVSHKVEGMFMYNLKSGISFDIVNQFNDRKEVSNDGVADTLYKYKDNLFNIITTYDYSEKVKFRLDYSNYTLAFDEVLNEYRDRTDNSFGFYLFYKFRPKTSVFGEYEFADIAYDQGTLSDSTEHRYYGGIQWDVTAKTRGRFKLGFIDKTFDQARYDDSQFFSMELQTQHNFTPKRALKVNAFRKSHETSTSGASNFIKTGIEASWLQRFREKWTGTYTLAYSQDDYQDSTRKDDNFSTGPALRFKPKKWLTFDLGYYYLLRNSTLSTYEYDANIIYFRADLSF